MGGDRGAEAIRRDLRIGLVRAGGTAKQRVVALPGLVEAADGRLEHRHPRPGGGERAGDHRCHDRLSDPGPGAGDEDASHLDRPTRLGGAA